MLPQCCRDVDEPTLLDALYRRKLTVLLPVMALIFAGIIAGIVFAEKKYRN
jgi:hypothetical protein